MTTRLDRYLVRQHLAPFLGSLLTLTLIVLLDQLIDLLGLVLKKGVGLGVMLRVLGLSLPFILTMTVPMAVLGAVLLVFGRMAQDHEVLALRAAGIRLDRVAQSPLLTALALALFMAYFNDQVLPESNHRLKNLLLDIQQKKPASTLRAGTFVRLQNFNIYVDRLDERTQKVWGIVIQERLPTGEVRLVRARTGTFHSIPDRMLILDLEDGKIYEATLREPDRLREVVFARYRVEIPMDSRLIQRQRSYRSDREMTTRMMWAEIQEQQRRAELTRDPEIRRASLRRIAQLWVEIHKKFAFAFAAPVFVLLGIPLAVRTRRGGFGTAFGVSFFVYVLYYLMIIAGEELGDRMLIPAWLGMWGPNMLFYTLGTMLLWRYR